MATAKKASEEKAKPKKVAAKPAEKVKKTATAKPKASSTTKKTSTPKPAAPERYRMIEVAAYYIAEKHGFAGSAADYWVQAEIEINAKYPK